MAMVLIALDGTEFHCSDKITVRTAPIASAARTRSSISTPCSPPPWWRRAITAPCRWNRSSSSRRTATTSRTAKAGRSGAGWRRMVPDMPRLKPVYLGDDLFSRQPICQAVLDEAGHFLFVCKPDSHPAIEEFRAGIKLDELTQKVRRGKQWVDLPVPMAVRCAAARRCQGDDRQLADDRDPRCRRGGDLSQQLHHRHAGQP